MAQSTMSPLLRAVEAARAGARAVGSGLEAEAEAEAYRIADRLSTGPYALATLRQMGHPYSKRRPRPPQDAAIINVQSGRFRRSWRIRASVTGFRLELDVENTSPEARFLLSGTRSMIARPYERRLREELQRAMPRVIARWIGGAFRR